MSEGVNIKVRPASTQTGPSIIEWCETRKQWQCGGLGRVMRGLATPSGEGLKGKGEA